MKRYYIALIVALTAACKSELKKQYEHTADEINPILLELRPVARKLLLAIAAKDRSQIIEVCYAVDPSLTKMAKLKLNFDERRAPENEFPLNTVYSANFAEWRQQRCGHWQQCKDGHCEDGRTLKSETQNCATACKEILIDILSSAEALRQRAKAEGVEIVSLTEPL
jgi:hypothetical protein